MVASCLAGVRKDPVTGVSWYTTDELLATLRAGLREAAALAQTAPDEENLRFEALCRISGLVLGCQDLVRTMLRNRIYMRPGVPLRPGDAFSLAETETVFGFLEKMQAMQERLQPV